jgi:hypothetical protein
MEVAPCKPEDNLSMIRGFVRMTNKLVWTALFPQRRRRILINSASWHVFSRPDGNISSMRKIGGGCWSLAVMLGQILTIVGWQDFLAILPAMLETLDLDWIYQFF